jgi:hypothetical protein
LGGLRFRPELSALEQRLLLTGPTPIPNLSDPSGIVTDPAGHVFISYVNNSTQGPQSVIGEFSAAGVPIRQGVLSSGIIAFPGSLALLGSTDNLGPIAAPGDVLTLLANGLMRTYRPSTAALNTLGDIEALSSIDTSAVYDVAQGRTVDLGGVLQPRFGTFNGVAIQGHDLLATGTYSNIEFVVRLRYQQDGTLQSAKVIVASTAVDLAGSPAPGIAVNAEGTVLTTLPVPQSSNLKVGVTTPVGFGINFDLGQGRAPFAPVASRVASLGITTDSLGNFVIALGPGACQICGNTPGLVEANATLTRFICIPIAPTNSNGVSGTRAVAVGRGADDLTIYTADVTNPDAWIYTFTYRALPGVPGDYNGDGKTEIATFQPQTAVWSIAGVGQFQFGMAGDIPVPGDYSGDGKTELAVYRPSTSQWFIQGIGVAQFGMPGDIPVPGVYSADGHVDIAVYRPSTAEWFYSTSHGFGKITMGQPNVDLPVPADYDGDGITDFAVYRPSTGQWFILGSTGSGQMVTFGAPGIDLPVPADYTGDGKADIAVYRPSTGTWYLNGIGGLAYGQPEVDLAVPADYLGVGHAQIAVYRPPTAQWFLTSSGVFNFGTPNVDLPANLAPAYWALGMVQAASRAHGKAAVTTGSVRSTSLMPSTSDPLTSSTMAGMASGPVVLLPEGGSVSPWWASGSPPKRQKHDLDLVDNQAVESLALAGQVR